MVCNATSIKQRRIGATLVEYLVSVGIGAMVLAAIMTLVLFSARSFAALTNYVDLDAFSRNALDVITREIRQADQLVSGSEHSMTFLFRDPLNTAMVWRVTYAYDSANRTLVRTSTKSGESVRVLLRECQVLRFTYFQRNPVAGTDLLVPTSLSGVNPLECKAVQMHWVCSRSIMQQAVNTESVQSARVVIRKV